MAAIGCALMQMLAPKDGMGKIFKLMLGAFFLCCMTMPLLQLRSILSLIHIYRKRIKPMMRVVRMINSHLTQGPWL